MSNNIEKYKDKGLTGLANLGNTCYINSCMQIISHTYMLNEIIDNINIDKLNNTEDKILLIEWKNLRDLMWSKNCCIAPNRFVNIIHQLAQIKNLELFTGFVQNDVPEFLYFVIDTFHNSIKENIELNEINISDDIIIKECNKVLKEFISKNYSDIVKLFYGIQISKIISENKTDILSVKAEPYCIISLPIPNKNPCNIFDCLDLYITSEFMNEENAWYNEKTKNKENVYKSLAFYSFPEILIIDFKRFNNFNKKINTLINTPINELDLTNYAIDTSQIYKYKLYGICNHSGECIGGHYTSFIRNANDKWYHFNDTNINEIKEENLITNKGYCYFYHKI